MVEIQFECKLKCVQRYEGAEFSFLILEWNKFGIIICMTCPYTSEKKGYVESRIRRVVECYLFLLLQSSMHIWFWNYASWNAIYLKIDFPQKY